MTALSSIASVRRSVVAALAMIAVAGAVAGGIRATYAAETRQYPSRPIHFVVPFGAGSQIDIAARLIGSKLADALRQPVVVDDYPGASGNIGADLVAKAAPDGYTLLFTGSLITLQPSVMGLRAVDPVASFVPITKVGEPPMVILAHPKLHLKSLADLVALARREPGKVAYATAGVGSVQHLVASIISRQAGIEMIHVPYANSGQALKDVVSGEVPVYFTYLGPTNAYLKSGELTALAVASHRRISTLPDVPTVVEAGYPEAAADPWNGFLAPAGTSPEIVALLYRELARIVQLPDVRERFLSMGMDPLTTSPEQFSAEIKAAVARWPAVARAAGVQPQQ